MVEHVPPTATQTIRVRVADGGKDEIKEYPCNGTADPRSSAHTAKGCWQQVTPKRQGCFTGGGLGVFTTVLLCSMFFSTFLTG